MLVIFAFSVCSFASADACGDHLDEYVRNGLYNTLHIKKTSSLQQDFASYFFSSDFESRYHNNAAGASATIPFKGIPVTFGGSSETQDAWEIRKENQNASLWSFNQQVFEEIYEQVADDQARQVWLEGLQVCYGGTGRVIGILTAMDGRSAQIRYSYYLIDQSDPIPVIINFQCSPSIDCDTLNKTYAGQTLVVAGEVFTFLWKDNSSLDGSVTMNTSRGASSTTQLQRTIYAPTAILTYSSTHQELQSVGRKVSSFSASGVGGMECNRQPCSPDGKWEAWDTAFVFQAPDIGKGAILRNANIAGQTQFCVFSSLQQLAFADSGGNVLPGAQEGPAIKAVVRVWSWGCQEELSGEEFLLKDITDQNTKDIPFSSNLLVISIPKSATDARLQLSINNKPVTFKLGESPSDFPQIKLVTKTETPAEFVYTYSAQQATPNKNKFLLPDSPKVYKQNFSKDLKTFKGLQNTKENPASKQQQQNKVP